MLTRTALALLALLLTLPASAQITYGAKLGVQAASVSFDADSEANFPDSGFEKSGRLGLVLGVTADVPLRNGLSARPGLLYTQKGYRQVFVAPLPGTSGTSGKLSGGEATTAFDVDYLEVPLLVAYTVTQPSGLSLSGEVGPTLAVLVGSGRSTSCAGCEGGASQSLDDLVDGFDLGLALGATVGSGPFGGGVRYTRALSNAFQNGGLDTERRWTNSTFAATLHYTFGAR